MEDFKGSLDMGLSKFCDSTTKCVWSGSQLKTWEPAVIWNTDDAKYEAGS